MVTQIEVDDLYELFFAASVSWARKASREFGVPFVPLLQATDPSRFHPGNREASLAEDILFVGASRGVFRPIIADTLKAGFVPAIYGHGWEEFVPPELVRAEHLPNVHLPSAYRSARVVLNDHWDDMKAEGFISNRLFDAAATGARIVSDDVKGLREIFGPQVATYTSQEELRALLSPDYEWPSVDELVNRAAEVAERHSFDARALELVTAVRHKRPDWNWRSFDAALRGRAHVHGSR